MPCKIQIEKNLTEEVDRMSLEGLSYPLEEAEKVAKKVNNLFNANVVRFYRIGDIVDRSINIPKSLIDKYYDNEKRLEEQEARSIQQEDAARAGVEYRDDYLFQIKTIFNSALELEDSLKSQNKTANALGSEKNVDKVLKKAGLDATLRQQFLQLLKDHPALKSIKLSEVINSYLKEFVKESDKQYYKAIDEPLSKELENILIDYFDKFYIRREELNNLKEKFGVDSVGVFDVLAKTIYYAKNRNLLTLPEEYGHVFVELLGSIGNKKADNPLFKYMFDNIESWDGYQRVYKDYKDQYVTAEGNTDIYKIKKEAIGQAIGIALVRNYKNNKAANKSLWDKIFDRNSDFWTKVQEIIDYLYSILGNMDYVNINLEADKIAKDILSKNYSKLDRLKKDTSNYNLLSYSETIENQNKKDGGLALSFMKWYSDLGNIITGSLAYRLQGTTYRPEIDALHDIDMIVPSDIHNVDLNKRTYLTEEELEKDRLYRKYISEGNYKEARRHKISGNLRLNLDKMLENEYFKKIKDQYPDLDFLYTFYNQKANAYYITVNAIWSKNQELKNRFKSYSGSFNSRLEKFTPEELDQIYLFDFFLRPETSDQYIKVKDEEFGLSLAHFNYAFYEKLNMMGRPKDAYDYQNWQYFDKKDILAPDFNDRMVYFQLSQERISNDPQRLKVAKEIEEITKNYDEQDIKNNNIVLIHSLEGLTVENTPESIENLLKSIKNGENVYLSTFPTRSPDAPLKERYESEYDEFEDRYEQIYKENNKYYHIPYNSDFHISRDPNDIKEITYEEYQQLAEKLEPTFLIGNDQNYIMISPNKGDVKWAAFSDVNSRYIEYKGEQIPYPTDTYNIMDSLSYLVRDPYNLHNLEWPEAVTKVTKENIVKFVYKGKTIIDNTNKQIQPTQVIKPGVSELFESNPDLANAVYEALGIKEKSLKSLNINYPSEVKFYKDNEEELLNKIPEWYDLKNNSLALITIAKKLGINTSDFEEFYNKHRNHYKAFKAYLKSEGISDETYFYKKEDGKSYFIDKNGEEQRARDEYGDETFISKEAKENTREFVENRELNFQSMNTYNDWKNSLISLQNEIKDRLKVTPQQKQQALQLYSQYLDTIFPDSKVKDIVYHGTDKKIEEEFIPKEKDAIFFTSHKTHAQSYAEISFAEKNNLDSLSDEVSGKGFVHLAIINITKPYYGDGADDIPSKTERKKKGYDGAINNDGPRKNVIGDIYEYAVFNVSNKLILGSKQDIQGFKEFVKGAKSAKPEVVKPTYTEGNLFEQKVNQKIEDYLATETSEDVPLEEKKPVPAETREQAIQDVVVKLKNLLTRLGITVKEFEEIYIEQQNINALTNKLQDTTLSEKERADIESQIQALKNKGLDKRALAVADIMNRTINISVDGKMEDLTEEVLHFIVDIIEQKDPALYKELYDKVWSYEKYKQVKKDYAGRYTTEEEFRKEAITQVLNDYLLNPLESAPESDYQNQKTESFWDKIVNKLNSLFTKTSNVDVNPFKIATEKLLRSDFITASDIQYLNSKGLFFSLRKEASAEEIRDNFLKNAKEMSIKENKDKQPRYFKGSREIAKRVSDLVSKYYGTLFRNNDKKDNALSEQVREEGVEIHSIFQHTFAKYVSPNGEVLSSPLSANQELKNLTAKYPNIVNQIDEVVKEIIKLNPNSYFLTELMVSDGYEIGGTLDLVIINKKNARVSIYDWKTKRYKKYDLSMKAYVQRTAIDWWNINGWRIQLSEYVKILRKNGVTNIGDVRMIPVMTKEKKIDGKWQIDTIEMTSFERSKVDPKKKELLPVIGFEEKSPYETINKITEKMRAVINQNIQRIKADYRLKADLEEENAILELMYNVLLATDNINSALLSLRTIIEDSNNLIKEAKKDFDRVNDLSDDEIYQYYKRLESNLSKLSIYFDFDNRGIKNFNVLDIAAEIYGKSVEEIISEHEQDLKNYKENPTEALKEKIKNDKPKYDISVSLGKINNNIEIVSKNLRDYSVEYFNVYSQRKGVENIKEEDTGQNNLFINNIRDLYSLNFKTARLASKILLKAKSIVADKNKQATNAMYALRDKFLESRSSLKSLEGLFKNLIKYDEQENDYFLIPEISDDFKIQYFEMKKRFEEGYYKNKQFFSTDEYKQIIKWLNDNIDMVEWEKDYEEKKKRAIKKFEELNTELKKQDPLEYDFQYNAKLGSVEYFNDIRVSAKAWNSFSKFKYANRNKWTSKEYLKLTDIEKEMHKKFTSIYSRAERIGYVQGYKNYYRIPFKLRQSQFLKQTLDPRKIFSQLTDEDIIYESLTRIDPVTNQEIFEIPIHMTNFLPAKEKGKLIKSLDLFQVYLEFEMNLNRFEEMSKVEDILLDVIKIEENKTTEKEVNMFGRLTNNIIKKAAAYDLISVTREDILKKLIYHDLYGIKYGKDKFFTVGKAKKIIVSAKRAYQWLNSYSNMIFIQANLKITGAAALSSSIVAATGTSKNIEGSRYLLSILKRISPLSKEKSYKEAFNYHLTQKETEQLNLKRTEAVKKLLLYGKQYAVDHLKLVDMFIQDSVFSGSLEKFLVINNKIVNADTYFSSLIPDQDKMSYKEIKQKEAELYKKHKKDTLLNYLQNNTKNGKTDISKLDKDSVYEFEQTIRLESKKIVGNSSDSSIFGMRLGFVGSAVSKFKTWMPELYNTFLSTSIKYRQEGKRFEAGRFASFFRAAVTPTEEANMTEDDKHLLFTAVRYVQSALLFLSNVGAFTVNVRNKNAIKRLETRYELYKKEAEEMGIEFIPTRKEYIDLNLQEAVNARNFLIACLILNSVSGVFAVLSGDDDPKEHPYLDFLINSLGGDLEKADGEFAQAIFGIAADITGKGLKELFSYYMPKEGLETFTKLTFPGLGAFVVLSSGVWNTIQLLLGNKENIKAIPDAIPFVRQSVRTYIKLTDDKKLQDLLNVDRRFRKKEKELPNLYFENF